MKRITLFLALFVVVAAAGAAEAGTDPRPNGPMLSAPLSAEEDACGTEAFDVPDRGRSFDFGDACRAHDACYASVDVDERLACDNAFLADMTTWCRDHWSFTDRRLYECLLVATVYYGGVRLAAVLF